MTIRRIIFCLLFAAFAMAMMSSGALAFCPMCKTVMEGSTGAQEIAGSLNLAALVLLAPPVMIFVALFGLFYRLRHANGQNASLDDEMDERASRRALTQ
jgi:heme/copper-type cytochrome/quinol oxidase subunit 3